jgi:hypothetical protein
MLRIATEGKGIISLFSVFWSFFYDVMIFDFKFGSNRTACGRLQAEVENTAALPEGSHYGDPPGSQPSSRTQTQQPHRQSTNYDWDTDTSEHS